MTFKKNLNFLFVVIAVCVYAQRISPIDIPAVSASDNYVIEDIVSDKNRVFISDSRVRFREAPNLESAVIRFFEKNEQVTIIEKSEQRFRIGELYSHWYKVKDAAGKVGWVYGSYLDINFYERPYIGIEEETLADKTIPENLFAPEKQTYEGGDGTVIERHTEGDIEIVTRIFKQSYNTGDYSDSTCRLFLHTVPDRNTPYDFFCDDKKFTCSLMQVKTNHTAQKTECWVKIVTVSGKAGWLYVGNRDPYKDNNWIVVGTIHCNGTDMKLRKYENYFSCQRKTPAYDRPSFKNSTVVWTAEETEDNRQINLRSLFVTDETYGSKYGKEHWVKVTDSYGRVGWMFGEALSIERGGFKYHNPQDLVAYAFWEP